MRFLWDTSHEPAPAERLLQSLSTLPGDPVAVDIQRDPDRTVPELALDVRRRPVRH
jgi:hypothetical protein